MKKLFDIDKFNIIKDEENYYFFRALNMEDNQDLEKGVILDNEGNIKKIRTDRERYEQNPENEPPKYGKDAEISLEQVYDHVKRHHRKDTNCISLSSDANVAIYYGRGFYKDRYVIVKVPKREFGKTVINAGKYMLEEISKKVDGYISDIQDDSKLLETISKIDNSKTEKEIRKSIPNEVCIKPKSPPQKKVTIAKQGIYKTICKQSIYSKTFFILIASYQFINFLLSLILKNQHIYKLYCLLLSQ